MSKNPMAWNVYKTTVSVITFNRIIRRKQERKEAKARKSTKVA